MVVDVKSETPEANVIILKMDLGCLTSIAEAVQVFTSKEKRLDILMNNAGIAFYPAKMTSDGFEIHWGTNFLGHALLTHLLIPTLKHTAAIPNSDVRVINVSSHGHTRTPPQGVDFHNLNTPMVRIGSSRCYGQSKLAIILFTVAMARHLPEVKTVAVNTGPVATPILRGAQQHHPHLAAVGAVFMKYLFRSVQEGVKSQLWCSVAATARSGEYYDPVGKPGARSELSKDGEFAETIWEYTGRVLKQHAFLGNPTDSRKRSEDKSAM